MAGDVVASLLLKLGVDATGLESGMAKADAAVTSRASAWSKLGRAGLAIGGAAFGIAAKGALEAENAMAAFQAETGATAEEARDVIDAVNAMSGSTTVAFSQIAESATKVRTDMGLMGDEAEKVTAQFVAYERATGQGAEAVLAFDDILDAWNLEADATAGIMDVLIASHQKYGGSIADNQRVLAQLAPALQAANMSWEEGQGLLNLFARAGVSGEAATTAFNRALSQVQSPEELKALLADISATEDPFERAQKAIDVFGARAGTKLAQALSDAEGDLSRFIVTTDEAAGTTEKAKDALEGTWGSFFKRMMNGATAALRGFGMELGPIITGLASMATLGQALGVGRWLPVGRVAKAFGGAIKAGWALGMRGLDRVFAPAMDMLGKAMGSRFGGALKAAGLLALGVIIAEGIKQLGEIRQANVEAVAKIDADLGAFLATAPTRADVEAKLAALKAVPEQLDGVGQAIMSVGDLGRGNILGSAFDGLFGANPAAVAADKIAALEDYLAGLPPDMEAAGEAAVTPVGDGMEAGIAEAGQTAVDAWRTEGKRLRDAIAATAGTVSGAWDAITNALAKGPKLQSFRSRMREATKAVAQNARMLGKAIRMGDTVGAAEYAQRLTEAKKARHVLRSTAEGTMKDAGAILGRHKAMVARRHKGITRDVEREAKRAARISEREAKTAAKALPDAIKDKESAVESAADASAAAATKPLETAATDATTWGSTLGANFAAGLQSQVAAVAAASAALASAAAGPIKAESPPRIGPLHTIDKWGGRLVDTWTRPIVRDAHKAERAGAALADAMGRGMRVAAPRGAGGTSGGRWADMRRVTAPGTGAGRYGRQARSGDVHVHVGTLIADDRGIDELTRRINRRLRLRGRGAGHYNEPG